MIPKSNAKNPWAYDLFLYKERHLIECFFQKIKSFLAFIYLSSIEIITR